MSMTQAERIQDWENYPLDRGRAIERLARALVKELEGLDPTDDWDFTLDVEANWARLNEQQKAVYRLCVEAVLSNDDLVKIVLRS